MQVGNVLLLGFHRVSVFAARDAYLHWGSARPTALLLIKRVIDEAREMID